MDQRWRKENDHLIDLQNIPHEGRQHLESSARVQWKETAGFEKQLGGGIQGALGLIRCGSGREEVVEKVSWVWSQAREWGTDQ